MNKITYENKEKLNDNVNIPNKQKCRAEDLNEIKSVVNGAVDGIDKVSHDLWENTRYNNSATEVSAGKYKCNLQKTLKVGDVITVMFPNSSTNAPSCSLSVDNGKTYYPLKVTSSYDLRERDIKTLTSELLFDGQYFKVVRAFLLVNNTIDENVLPTDKFVNGKRVYEKMFEFNYSTETTLTKPLGFNFSNVTLIKIDGIGYSTSNNVFNLNIGDVSNQNTYSQLIKVNGTTNKIELTTNINFNKVIVTLEFFAN